MTRSAKEISREVTAYYKAKQQAREETLAPKIEALKNEVLPTLKGSEKQIAWATEIRLQKLAELEQLMEEALVEMPGEEEFIKAKREEYKTRLLKITHAGHWIAAREYKVEDIITSVCTRLGI